MKGYQLFIALDIKTLFKEMSILLTILHCSKSCSFDMVIVWGSCQILFFHTSYTFIGSQPIIVYIDALQMAINTYVAADPQEIIPCRVVVLFIGMIVLVTWDIGLI